MKRAVLAVFVLSVLAGVVWPVVRSAEAEPADEGLCGALSATRLLEQPALADLYAEALRSGDASEVGRFTRMLREIRSAHGCEGDLSLPDAPHAAPRLPPGHPPVGHPSPREGGREPAARFEPPSTVTI